MQIRDLFPCLNKSKPEQKGEVYSDTDHSNHEDDDEIDGRDFIEGNIRLKWTWVNDCFVFWADG